MATRFIARIARHIGDDTNGTADFKVRLAAQSNFAVQCDHAGLIVAVKGSSVLRCGPHGLIIGSLFDRSDMQAVSQLGQGEAARIVESRGQRLIDAYWGPYVAFLQQSGSGLALVRAPWGELPAYRCNRDGTVFLASDLDLLIDCAGYQPTIDWGRVLFHLAHGHVHHRTTCLSGIESLPGGERLCLSDKGETRELLWSPWTYAAPERQVTTSADAIRLIKGVALASVKARASQFGQALVTLSGGLDSSIVAASLASAQALFSAMTLQTRDPVGDERNYAELAGTFLGCPLTASLRDVTKVDVGKSGAQGRPYPCVHGFLTESMRLAQEAADLSSAEAIFNGSGGDTVFCSLRSGAPAADRLLVEGWGKGFFRTVRAISQLAPASIPQVLRDAIARAWLGKPAFRLSPQLGLLSPDARSRVMAQPDHPWLPVPPGILPGRARHGWMLAYCKAYVESFDPCGALPVVAPLLSQPVVEACLSVPSWMWFDGGHNRMVARQAFEGLLPPEILTRRSKGTPSSFTFEIFEVHRESIRTMLAEGQLAAQGLIDLSGITRLLDSPRPASEGDVEQILNLVDVEAWAASWSGSAR